MDEQAGVTVSTASQAETQRSMMTVAARVMLPVESSRWHTVDLRTVAALHEVDLLVTDAGLRPAARGVIDVTVGRLAVVPA
jgi:DeoR/GlpR family transcriptional regulator of sugar metabolism